MGALLPQLSQHFATIALSGPHLGYMSVTEGRGQAGGYLRIVRNCAKKSHARTGKPTEIHGRRRQATTPVETPGQDRAVASRNTQSRRYATVPPSLLAHADEVIE